MMGVYVKGMEMPNDCRDCPFETYYNNCGITKCRAIGKDIAIDWKCIPWEGRAEWCPLIEQEDELPSVQKTGAPLKISKTVNWEEFKKIIKNSPLMFITSDTEKIELIREQQWIPCSERLPEDKQVVLITNGKRNVRCGQFRGTGFSNSDCNKWIWKNNIIETVIAWMPLPSPYKGEEQ